MKEGGKVTKEETPSDFLKEYESHTQKFRNQLTFFEFCKIKVKGKEQQDRFHLSTFGGSPSCSTKYWVKEINTFQQ